jgi:hypothetical protein
MISYTWEPSPREYKTKVFKCHSTNCRHKAVQFIQLGYHGNFGHDKKFILGYCKKHAKSERYVKQRWGDSFGWTFERFLDRDEVLVDEIMRS